MKKTILTIAIILILSTCVVTLTGCGEKKVEGIVGKWAYSSFVYTFNEDKTGTYDVSGNVMDFTYEDDGSKISILFTGNTSPLELNYRLEDNKLIITDSFGEEVEYTKK